MKLAMKNMKVLFKVKEFSMFWQHQKSKKIADSMKFPQHGLPAPVRKKDITRTRVFVLKITTFYGKSSCFP